MTSLRKNIKSTYFMTNSFLYFRNDYYEDSPLYAYINSAENENVFSDNLKIEDIVRDQRKNSFSKEYIQEFDRNSISSSIEKEKIEISSSP